MRRPAFIARQGAHPSGCLGAIIGRIMAKETARDNERAIELLDVQKDERVLDIGTGHGRSLGLIANAAPGVVATGIDSSDVMLSIAAKTNRTVIRKGRVRIEKASSDKLPFANESFDAALAMHTLYFWQPAEPHLAEIARVLKRGGRFVLGFRPAEDKAVTRQFPESVYTFRSTDQVEALLMSAGFSITNCQCRDKEGDSIVWLAAKRT